MGTMFEWCDESICQVATPRYVEGHGRVEDHLTFSFGHGNRLECGRCY